MKYEAWNFNSGSTVAETQCSGTQEINLHHTHVTYLSYHRANALSSQVSYAY